MENTAILHQLAHTLSAGELRYLQMNKSHEGESLNAALLDILLKMERPDNEQLAIKWRLYNKRKPFTLKSLENTKSRLKDRLLEAINHNNLFILGGEIEKGLYTAEAYLQHHLPSEAIRCLMHAYEEHHEIMSPMYKVQLLQKLLVLLPLIKLENHSRQRTTYYNALRSAIQEEALFHEIYCLYLQVTNLYMENTIVKTDIRKKQLSEIAGHPLMGLATDTLAHIPTAYLLKTRGMVLQMQNDLKGLIQNQYTLCLALQKFKDHYTNTGRNINYLQEHINLGVLYAQTANIADLPNALNPIRESIKNKPHYHEMFNAQMLFVEALCHYFSGDIDVLRPALKKCDSALRKTMSKLPPTLSEGFRYGLMKCWLACGEHEMVDMWFMERSTDKPFVKLDGYFVMYLIRLCSDYEKGKTDLQTKTYQLPNGFLKRALQFTSLHTLSKTTLPLEYQIHKTFLELAKAKSISAHQKLLQRLGEKLDGLAAKEHPYLEQFYRMFNLRKWIRDMDTRLSK